jgi:hypothetical protein
MHPGSLFLRFSLFEFSCSSNSGLLPIFDNVHPVGENNGEVYLSKYFEEQMVRNQTVGQDKKTSMYQCPTCTTYMLKNTQQQTSLFAPEQKDNNANNTNDNNNDASMRNLPVVPVVPPFFMQPPPPSTAAFLFVPPIPLAELAHGGVGCSCGMIAATWLEVTIVQLMLRIFGERRVACKSCANHRMK